MAIGIFAAVLGLVLAAAAISIPQLVRFRHQRPDDDDTQAYLRETGRSARDIAQENAALRAQQDGDARAQHASGSDSAPPQGGAGSHETS
jgi:hypothetical protein